MVYGLLSDVHANLTALEAVLETLKNVDKLICPGDVVGYGPDPAECISRLRSLECSFVIGNHDAAVCGMMDLGWFNPFARAAVEWTREMLSEADIKWLSLLPLKLETDEFVVVHSSLADPAEFPYILSLSDAKQCFEMMDGYKICFIGHSHVAGVYVQQEGISGIDYIAMPHGGKIQLRENSRYIVNCGSVGQPRDGNPDAACALFDTDKMTIEILRVPYNIEQVQARMHRLGLPRALAERLKYGV